jgi:TRAP-type C4-dicarboxylate transport system permease small subunit|tara:strand:+ start:1854 stop:2447 length:594 start_codon:yes stop_codon:yes gene_type:complete
MSKLNGQQEGAQDALPEINFENTQIDISDFNLWDVPGLVALWALSGIVFLQFFTRYVLNDSLAWTEEIARYVLIIVAYFGAVSVTRKGTHIFLEFFYRYLSPQFGKYLTITMEAISMLFYGYLGYQAILLALKTRTKMASAEIPKSLLYWCVAASLIIMAGFSVYWLARKIRQSPRDILREMEEHALHEIPELGGKK